MSPRPTPQVVATPTPTHTTAPPNDPGHGESFCQQWSPAKTEFAWALWARERINMRVLLAWMAVESGGARQAASVGYNFLQVFSGDQARRFNTNHDAYRATVFAIRERPEILHARGRGPAAQMDAITRAWARGPGNAATVHELKNNPGLKGYRQRLQDRFDCIDPTLIQFVFHVGTDEQKRSRDIANRATSEELNPVEKAGQFISDAISGIADDIWPVLLKAALATTGLALIGYGVKQLVGSNSAAEHTQQATSTAGAVAGGA